MYRVVHKCILIFQEVNLDIKISEKHDMNIISIEIYTYWNAHVPTPTTRKSGQSEIVESGPNLSFYLVTLLAENIRLAHNICVDGDLLSVSCMHDQL